MGDESLNQPGQMVFWGSPWQLEVNLGPSATSGKIALGKWCCNRDHEITRDGLGGVAALCLECSGPVSVSGGHSS